MPPTSLIRLMAPSSPAVVYLGADPPVVDVFDAAEFRCGQRRQTGRGGVLPGLLWIARARDHGGDARLLDHPAQRGLCRGGTGGDEGGELPGRVDAGIEVNAGEGLPDVEGLTVAVVAAMVAGCEGRVVGVPARQQPRGERDAGDDPH